MAQEVELKLAIAPRDVAALRRHPLLAGTAPRQQLLHNTYYDTPDLALHARKIALRFRRKGDQWLLTVKAAAPATGGLSARAEWEQAAVPGVFDFAMVDDRALRELLETLRPQLQPIFTTHFERSIWLLEPDAQTRIEVALDAGSIEANGRTAPIHELELELLAGASPVALFATALSLAQAAPLLPLAPSKAERAYRLYGNAPITPVKATGSPLYAGLSLPAAAILLCQHGVRTLESNAEGILQKHPDLEFVHQARVAIRRTRTALKLFRPVLPKAFRELYEPAWRNVANALGQARDWDVLLEETLPRLHALGDGEAAAFAKNALHRRLQVEGERQQKLSRRFARESLLHPGYGKLLLRFAESLTLLELDANTAAANTRHQDKALGDFMRRRLQKWLTDIQTRCAGPLATLSDENRHRLRIHIKRLRYGLEFALPLLGAAQRERVDALRKLMGQLQDELGVCNDIATARKLVHAVAHTPDEDAVFFAALARLERQTLDRLEKARHSVLRAVPLN